MSIAQAGPLDDLQSARACLLRGQITFASNHGSDAPPLLLKAARQFKPLDERMARDTYLEALLTAGFAGRLAADGIIREIAEAACEAPPPSQTARPPDLLLNGLALLITRGYPAGTAVLERAVTGFGDADVSAEEVLRWMWLATVAARLMWDYESWDALSARLIQTAREAGALTALHLAFGSSSLVRLFAGEFAEAASLVVEAQAVTGATGSSIAPYAAMALAAFRGREPGAGELIEASARDVRRRGEGLGLTFTHWAAAVLYNGQGRYEQALAAARQASEDLPGHPAANWGLAELIEAATRIRESGLAADALSRLSQATRASGTDWALGIQARSQALVSAGEDAEARYREAIGRLGRTRLRVELGRAHLLYGEWLRRQQRRRDARDQLALAHEIFDAAGMAAFAERARIELRASGGHARNRTAQIPEALTAQEAMIARLADGGASNQQIAGQLFISSATVAYHLRKVYAKLGIGSRGELAGLVPTQTDKASAIS